MKPYPKYKDSGVEWLGDPSTGSGQGIPEGWEVKKVKYILANGQDGMKIGPFGSALKLDDMSEKGIKVYGQENVIYNNFNLGQRRINVSKFDLMRVYTVKPKDILITMMGTSGRCVICTDSMETGIIDSHLLRIRVNQKAILSKFFEILLDKTHFVKCQVENNGKGSIMHGLNSAIVKELLYVLPPLQNKRLLQNF